MSDIEKLKSLRLSLIELAIRGRLVEQRSEEGSTHDLFEKIQHEKAELIKDGKLKKEKALPEIDEDEIPFEIPESWGWVRLGTVSEINIRNILDDNLNISFIPMANVNGGFKNSFTSDIKKWKDVKNGYRHMQDGQIIVAKITPCFQNRKSTILQNLLNGAGAGSTEFHTLLPKSNLLLNKYLLYIVKSDYFIIEGVYSFEGTAGQQRVSTDFIERFVIPLPPLAEQKRIVDKLEEKLAVIDKAIALLERKDELDKQIKKKILQMAIQGKLVEQRSEEGTAHELFENIQQEKAKLIKEGKLKKEKALPEVDEDEIPFEIPESWKWVRIGSIFSLSAGKNIKAEEILDCESKIHKYKCYGGNGVRGYVSSFNREGDYPIIGRQGALCGNIKKATGQFYATEHAICVDTFCNVSIDWVCKALEFLNLNQYSTATAQPGISAEKIAFVYFPLSPLAEQKRIVAEIERLFSIIEKGSVLNLK